MVAINKNRHLIEGVVFAPVTLPFVNFLAGVIFAFMVLPFGIIAAALAPVVIGFAKEIYNHFASRAVNPANFAWMIAGAATSVACIKLF